MLDQHIIQPSSAPAYSQVLLVPKPDGDMKFCMDLHALNRLHIIEWWSIPNIQAMLQDIELAEPKYFLYYGPYSRLLSSAISCIPTRIHSVHYVYGAVWRALRANGFERRNLILSTITSDSSFGWLNKSHLCGLHWWCVHTAINEVDFVQCLKQVFARFK
jgi:hypothetical protein